MGYDSIEIEGDFTEKLDSILLEIRELRTKIDNLYYDTPKSADQLPNDLMPIGKGFNRNRSIRMKLERESIRLKQKPNATDS